MDLGRPQGHARDDENSAQDRQGPPDTGSSAGAEGFVLGGGPGGLSRGRLRACAGRPGGGGGPGGDEPVVGDGRRFGSCVVRLLAQWRHLDASELPRTELLRHVIEHSLLAAHRHVFGVFFWFVLGSAFGLGPAGAVLYRMAELASRYWAFKSRTVGAPVNERLMRRSQWLFGLIDHVPARLTAFGFAVVGNFEEAITCWRRDAGLWKHENEGIILAAAAGAVGVQLGGSAAPGVTPDRSKTFEAGVLPEAAGAEGSTPGLPPLPGHLRSIVGLVWRSVVLWMLLLALLTLANLIG